MSGTEGIGQTLERLHTTFFTPANGERSILVV